MDWRTDFYEARWHLDVAKRMLVSYDEYGSKRFLIGVIREGARTAGCLVRAFLILDGTRGNLKTFVEDVAPRYLDKGDVEGLVKILKVERAQGKAKVEFMRKDELLLEVNGGWKILKVSRLRKLIDDVNEIVNNFPTGIKR